MAQPLHLVLLGIGVACVAGGLGVRRRKKAVA